MAAPISPWSAISGPFGDIPIPFFQSYPHLHRKLLPDSDEDMWMRIGLALYRADEQYN
jgi:hypothetical protein